MAASVDDLSLIKERLSDRWWRLNNLYYVTDKFGRRVLFHPNEVQADLDDNLHALNIILKSRQHGVTTWACIRALDTCLFRDNINAGIVAHTAGDAAKFFRKKVLFAYDNLPDWLKKLRPAVRRDMRDGILELSNGSSIEVSVSHRGGTLQFLHVSEYGPMCAQRPEAASEVASGALNAVAPPRPGEPPNIIIIESTAYGAAGDYYERCQTAIDLKKLIDAGKGVLTEMDYKFHFYGWYMDPANSMDPTNVVILPKQEEYFRKIEAEMDIALSKGQKAWYVKKAAEQRDKMLREHPSTPDEAFAAATAESYYGSDMAAALGDGRICELPIRFNQPVHTFWDIGHSDKTAIWFMQEDGPWYNFIDYYEANGEQLAHFVKVLRERGYLYGKHYWPHDGDNTDWSGTNGKTRKQLAEDLKLKPIEIVDRIDDITTGIDMVRQVLPRCRFDSRRCGPQEEPKSRGGIEAMRQYKKQWNPKTETFSDYPAKSWANHGADAFRQFAQGYTTSSGRKVATKPDNVSWRTA